jgi:hypothetical protein
MTLMMVGALMLALTAAVAFAATIRCTTGSTCFGTNEADTLIGTKFVDNIQGRGGDDSIEGRGGDDFLAGDQAFEQSLRGNDTVDGGSGNDELEGNQDNDVLIGGPGNDKLNPLDGQQPGTQDTVKGDAGDDDVFANDGNKDVIDCGRGSQDIVRYDVGIDTIRNCEILHPFDRDVTAPAPPSAIDLLTDTGADTNDDLTSDTTPTFNVTAEKGSTVELFYEGASGLVSIGSGTADATTGVANITVPAGSALADGTYTIVAKATDAAGNVSLVSNDASLQVKVESNIAVDATAPDTTIDTNPDLVTDSDSATFTFSSNEQGATFECKLDGDAAFSACTSPQSYSGLNQGDHTFQVRATDSAGNVDATPATHGWTVGTIGPNASITDGPLNSSDSRSATFTFTGAEADGSYECKIDGEGSTGTFSACTSGQSFTVDADGTYTFYVRASDALGNFGTPDSYSWTVDTTAPDTTIDTKPSDPSNNASPSFTFSSSEENSTFECKLDNEASFTSCSSPKALSSLGEGSHTFQVRAKDAAGNVDGSPASYTWTVDTTTGGPVVTVTPTTLDLSIDGAHGDVLFCRRSEFLTVTNEGPGEVTFAAVDITGTDARYFSSGSQRYLAQNGPFTVADGNHFQDEVTFTAGPTAEERNSAKVYRATLTYKDSKGNTIGDPVSLTAQARCLNFG